MSTDPVTIPDEEAAPHSGREIPDDERAKEIGVEESADLHGDPDDPEEQAEEGLEAPDVWRVAKALLALRAQINAIAPTRDKGSDGTIGDAAHFKKGSASDHNPWIRDGGMGVVTGMDVTHSPAKGCDGDTIAKALRKAKDPRIKYIIWNRQIANASAVGGAAAWDWRPYTGKNAHNHHIHISVKAEKARFDDAGAWTLPKSLATGASV